RAGARQKAGATALVARMEDARVCRGVSAARRRAGFLSDRCNDRGGTRARRSCGVEPAPRIGRDRHGRAAHRTLPGGTLRRAAVRRAGLSDPAEADRGGSARAARARAEAACDSAQAAGNRRTASTPAFGHAGQGRTGALQPDDLRGKAARADPQDRTELGTVFSRARLPQNAPTGLRHRVESRTFFDARVSNGLSRGKMAKSKRKSKSSRAPKTKKKVKRIKVLKKKSGLHKRTAPKKTKAAKKPLKKILAKKSAAPAKPQVGKPAAKPEEKKGKGALKGVGKPSIKSAKAALELLEANVAAAKAKGKGRPGRKGKKDAWLIPPEMPKEDAETRRTRLKNLIKLGKDR